MTSLFGGGRPQPVQTVAAPVLEPVADEPSPPDPEAEDQAAKLRQARLRNKSRDSRLSTIMTEEDTAYG